MQDMRRMLMAPDSGAALRMLHAGRCDFTVLPASVVYGDCMHTADVPPFDAFQCTPLLGLPPYTLVAYVSRQRPVADQQSLLDAINTLFRDDYFECAMQAHYPRLVYDRDLRFPGPRARHCSAGA
jgi:hypothetical protein